MSDTNDTPGGLSELRKVTLPDGGEVYKGDAATRALDAVGARAMTFDRHIYVAEDFDPGRAEDLALYAHERHHQDESGGEGSDHMHDAEEVAARAIEAMVFHRTRAGDGDQALIDAKEGRIDGLTADGKAASRKSASSSKDLLPQDAAGTYQALRAQGWSHEDVVKELAKQCIDALDDKARTDAARHKKHTTGW